MAARTDEHERTVAFAEIALGQIKALRQAATPRTFEVWYTYATGYNPSLNQSINETLEKSGTLTDVDIERIHGAYIAPTRISERIDNVGARVHDEIEQVMSMVDSALGTANSYSESLAGASEQLTPETDRESLRTIIESLVQTTAEMEQANQKLELRLSASKQEISRLQENLEAVRSESLTDPLTSLANRKSFDAALHAAVAAAHASGEPLTLVMTDIDHFKQFNDTFGHLTGDQVLRLVALSVKQNVKGRDIAARYGGEEFAIVLPTTPLRAALSVADQIRRVVMTKELKKRSTGENLGRVTISAGVAALAPGESAQSLIGRTDACLYAAKRQGRNRVVIETDPDVTPSQARVA